MKKQLSLLLFTLWLMNPGFAQPSDRKINNIVLVHGAFLDGSGWEGVYQILTQKGYKVSVTQHSLKNFEDDVASVERIIDLQDGPCLLVGHSYGGVVISAAGNHPKVAGLVYIAAHAPDAGEKRADLVKTHPPAYQSLVKGSDGFDYIRPEKFPEDFAADLPLDRARFMANAQIPTADLVFQAVIQNPAWKTKPSWYMVAGADRIINPDLERFYAKRAQSRKVVEIKGGSHAIYASRPNEVAELIETAATGL
ncbi:alpha/beta hydrolase [Flavobacterium sp.]|uniref:alpha/beta hydrolase n=1 Tax=Flavobacterium sp. TaxID=239 RepID=UPI0039E6B757